MGRRSRASDFDALVARAGRGASSASAGATAAIARAGCGSRRRGAGVAGRSARVRWVGCVRRGWRTGTGWPRWSDCRHRAGRRGPRPGSPARVARAIELYEALRRRSGRRAGPRAAPAALCVLAEPAARADGFAGDVARLLRLAKGMRAAALPRRCRGALRARRARAARAPAPPGAAGAAVPTAARSAETAEQRRQRVRDARAAAPAATRRLAERRAGARAPPAAGRRAAAAAARARSVRGARRRRRPRRPLPRRARPRPLATRRRLDLDQPHDPEEDRMTRPRRPDGRRRQRPHARAATDPARRERALRRIARRMRSCARAPAQCALARRAHAAQPRRAPSRSCARVRCAAALACGCAVAQLRSCAVCAAGRRERRGGDERVGGRGAQPQGRRGQDVADQGPRLTRCAERGVRVLQVGLDPQSSLEVLAGLGLRHARRTGPSAGC